MKKQLGYIIIIVSAILIITFSLHIVKHKKFDRDIQFGTLKDRKRALNYYAQKAQEVTEEKQQQYLIKFFQAFPRDFKTFFQLSYRYYGDTLYVFGSYYKFSHNPWCSFYPIEKLVKSFDEIPKQVPPKMNFPDFNARAYDDYYAILRRVEQVIPKKIYYQKMLSVGIGGFWDSDDISSFSSHLMQLIYQDTALAVRILEQKTDDEIASFWFFLYDGPHPDNYQEAYDSIYQEIMKLSSRVAGLMKKAYERLLSEEHCPGH